MSHFPPYRDFSFGTPPVVQRHERPRMSRAVAWVVVVPCLILFGMAATAFLLLGVSRVETRESVRLQQWQATVRDRVRARAEEARAIALAEEAASEPARSAPEPDAPATNDSDGDGKPDDVESSERATPPGSGNSPSAESAESTADPELAPSAATIVDEEKRPEWVEKNPFVRGNVWYIPVSSGLARSASEAAKQLELHLELQVQAEVSKRVNQVLGEEGLPISDYPGNWRSFVEQSGLLESIMPDRRYEEKIVSGTYGVYYQAHALLEIDTSGKFDQLVRTIVREVRAYHRSWWFTLGAFQVLGVLALAWGVLSLPFGSGKHATMGASRSESEPVAS